MNKEDIDYKEWEDMTEEEQAEAKAEESMLEAGRERDWERKEKQPIKEQIEDIDCEGCEYLKYESDTNAYICTSKNGCIRKNGEVE